MTLEYDLLILNGIVVTDNSIQDSDIAIKDEKIARIVPRGGLGDARATKVIDAEGGYVMVGQLSPYERASVDALQPGGVDAHVHLQEPPLFGKGSTADNYETGSRSAVCGGTTTMVTFAPQKKTEDTLLDTLKATHEKAKDNCYVDYSFHLLVGNPSARALSEFKTLREEGISSLKIYMTYEALQLADGEILDVLLEARRQGITTMIHAENGAVIDWMTAQLSKRQLLAPKYHASSHPPVAEIEATYRAISLSEFMDAPILIVHVSTPAAASKRRKIVACPFLRRHVRSTSFLQRKTLTKKDLRVQSVYAVPRRARVRQIATRSGKALRMERLPFCRRITVHFDTTTMSRARKLVSRPSTLSDISSTFPTDALGLRLGCLSYYRRVDWT
jgi:dihydroorotase-like cyclic amidohydrolase